MIFLICSSFSLSEIALFIFLIYKSSSFFIQSIPCPIPTPAVTLVSVYPIC